MENYTILGVCAGNGAVLYPFKDQLITNIEPRSAFNTPGQTQWSANFPNQLKLVNLKQVEWVDTPTAIIGHPDCGHSSVLAYSRGKKLSDPKDNKSLTMFIESIQQFQPKVFLMENLPALLKTYGKEDLKEAFKGYNLKIFQGSVSKWGNSQLSRKRLVIIGVRKDLNKEILAIFKLPKQENIRLKVFKELDSALGSPDSALCHVRLHKDTNIAIFGGKKMTLGEIKEAWLSFPKSQRRFPANKERMKYAPGVYRNLKNSPPLTVRKGNREFAPNGEVLTPRQRARIQGLPDSFKLLYEEDRANFWITKSNITATKCFPYEIALWFKTKLERAIKKQLLTP